MVDRVPARIRVAVDAVDPGPEARVLEIGCGAGVAMALVCPRLVGGHVTGLDRSSTAIARAERRLRRYLDEGVADLQHRDVAAFHGDGRSYDTVFAVNVNVFWTGPADAEASRLRELVADAGVVRLFYELPGGADEHPAGGLASSALRRAGFRTALEVVEGILCVSGRPQD